MIEVSVARDFTRYPAGRLKRNGTTSGEAFRERFLERPIARGESVSIELDGTIGYGSSFLEEAFGGLVRSLELSPAIVKSRLNLISQDQSLLKEIDQYIDDAGAAR